MEDTLKVREELIAEAPTPENLANLETIKMEYEREFDYIVRGSIIRSRATWYEQGERNTKYFLNLKNNNKTKSYISTIQKPDETETTDANVILEEIYTFYSDLYNVKPDIQTDLSDCPFFTSPAAIPRLNEAMKEICEGQLTYSECFKVLSTFENNKTPGNDESFINSFGQNLALLVDSLNYAYIHRELSNSQKQAVLSLIEKKERDRRLIKNWRPIFLVNVDVKIGKETFAKRLEKVLPHITHHDQNAFVKEQTIFDAVRTISDDYGIYGIERISRNNDRHRLCESL